MGFVIRALKVLLSLVVFAGALLWFAARRGDRGYFEEEVTIARPASVVFRWLTTDELLRHWISDLNRLERIGGSPAQPNSVYVIDELIASQRVLLIARTVRVTPNQELQFAVTPAAEGTGGFHTDAKINLLPGDEYTQVSFSSHTSYLTLGGKIFEPILTYAARRKVREDLRRLKIMMEAEPAFR
jgi:hypothetical protein